MTGEAEAVLYDLPTWIIALTLLFMAIGANEVGFRYGRYRQGIETDESKAVSNTLNAEAVRTSLIVPAINEVIDLRSTRSWANRNHLPDPVLALLLVGLIVTSLLLGHSSGQTGQRHPGLWLASNVVLAMVLYVVLDFDRPRRGLILIDQSPLIELRASLN